VTNCEHQTTGTAKSSVSKDEGGAAPPLKVKALDRTMIHGDICQPVISMMRITHLAEAYLWKCVAQKNLVG
jgi:hypothetical protein